MEWGAVIAAVAGLLLYVLKQYAAGKPERNKERSYDATQQGRADIDAGDAAAVNNRIDRLLTESDHPAGQPGRPVTAERIGTVSGLADPGRSIGADTGKG